MAQPRSLEVLAGLKAKPNPKPKQKLSRPKKLLFAFVFWVGATAVAELGGRTYLHIRDKSLADLTAGYSKRRDLRLKPLWSAQNHVHPYLPYLPRTQPPDVDMRGLRLTSPEEVKPPDVYRVFCLGGSTTYFGYPTKLEAELSPDFAARGLRLEVVNAADISWTTAESFIDFALRCVPYAPDAIIVYHAANDAWPAFGSTWRADYSHWRKRLEPNHPLFWDRLPPFLDRSAAFVLTRHWFEKDAVTHTWASSMMQYIPKFDSDPYHGVESYRRNIVSLIGVARAHGVQVLLSTQVCNEEVRQRRYVAAIHEMNDMTRSFADAGPGIAVVDAAAAIPGNNELMYDICHFRPERDGETLLIGTLAEAVRGRLNEWVQGRAATATASR